MTTSLRKKLILSSKVVKEENLSSFQVIKVREMEKEDGMVEDGE